MIRQYLELVYPTLADAQARGPGDVSRLVAHLTGCQLAGPLACVERSDEAGATRGVVGFELERATRLSPFDPAELLAKLRADDAARQASNRPPATPQET